MGTTSHLAITTPADGVENLEQLLSDALEQVDQAMQGELAHTDTTSFSLSATEFTNEFHHHLTGTASPAITLSVPATKRAFMITNDTGDDLTVQVTGGLGVKVTLYDGEKAILYSDGADIHKANFTFEQYRLTVPASDETTPLTNGTAKVTFRQVGAVKLSEVRASLGTANSSGGPITIDINKNGTTMLSTKLTIDDTEKTSVTAATAAVLSVTAIADDDEISVDIDSGSNDGAGLKISFIGRYT